MNIMVYYERIFAFKQFHNWEISDIEDLMPWEFDVMTSLLSNFIEQQEMLNETSSAETINTNKKGMLDKLVASERETQKRLASIEKSVNMLLKVNTQTAKREAVQERRRAAVARREKSDKRGTFAEKARQQAEAKDKKKGGIFDTLKNLFMGVLAAPLIIKAVGALAVGAIGFVLTHEPTRKKLFELMGKVAEFMGKILTKALQAAWAGLKFGAKQAGNFLSGLPGKSDKQKKAEAGCIHSRTKETTGGVQQGTKREEQTRERILPDCRRYRWSGRT